MYRTFARLRPLTAAAALMATSACDGGGGTEPEPEPTVAFSLTADTLWLAAPGDTAHLEVRRADGQLSGVPGLTWRMLESATASVSAEGVVTAQAPGLARVVAQAPGAADTLTVKVAKYVSLGVGAFHTCAVTEDGAMHCWGANSGDLRLLGRELPAACAYGSLRDWCGRTPLRVPNVPPMARAFPGFGNTCAVTMGGQGWCWGANGLGGAGTSTSPEPQPPAPLLGGVPVATMSINGRRPCLLTPQGAAYCWGEGDFSGPQPVETELRFSSYVTSTMRCGIESGSTSIRCFGGSPPAGVADRAWLQIVASWDHYDQFCALDAAGGAWCWGPFGGLEKFSGQMALEQIATGRLHHCGLTDDGQAFCWGWNDKGQLGRGSAGTPLAIDSVAGGHRFRMLGAGERHTCGLTPAGTLYCWGNGQGGAVGDGPGGSRSVPVRVHAARSPA